MIATITAATLENAINRYLKLDPQTSERLGNFAGKVILIESPDWKIKFYFLFSATGVQVLRHYEGNPDTIIKGSLTALLRISTTDTANTKLFSEVTIEGDLELGQQFRNLLKEIDIDWEEHLSKFTGDIVAHQIGSAVKNFLGWGKQSANSLRQNLTEYLQEEAKHLPPRQEVEDFFADIYVLQNDVARLEAKVKKL